ncbi:MAG TPA: hypothetical protein VMW82_00420 [Candidatus Paceibacterota bacterium]|nr:hypothetical protein [Candidatus Paceibacterota bacterium]
MQNLLLGKNDEFFSIIDKIKLGQDTNIVLVIPLGTTALRSIINLRILKEESGFLGKNIYIATSDEFIKKLAKQVGIKLTEKQELTRRPERAGRIVDLRIMSDIMIQRKEEKIEEEEAIEEIQPEPELEPESRTESIFSEPLPERPEKPKKIRRFKFKFFTPTTLKILLVVLCLLALAWVVFFIFPRAQVVINPKREKVQFEDEITADKSVDSIKAEEAIIPAQYFETEKMESREFPSTGERDVLEKARGKITVYNQFSSSPQTLVKTTRFRSKDGKIFRLISTVTIPGATIDEGKIIASNKEVDVEADEAGEAYNIGPSDFTIPGFEGGPKYTAFYGKSTEPMTGGAKGKMKVATADDIKGAANIVILGLKEAALKDFQAKISAGLKILDNGQATEIIESSSNLKANQPGEKFIVTVRIKVSGLAFKEEDALYLIEKTVSDEIPNNRTLLFSTIKVDYSVSKLNLAQGKVDLSCKVEAESITSIDEQKIKNDLAGKSEEDVRKYLSSLPEIETAKVIFWPFWVKKVPANKDKIKVITKVN